MFKEIYLPLLKDEVAKDFLNAFSESKIPFLTKEEESSIVSKIKDTLDKREAL